MQSKSKKQTAITIESLTTFSPDIAQDIRRLTRLLGNNNKELSDADLKEMISSPHISQIVAKNDSHIVGMVTLIVYRIPYVRKAYLDDLVVDDTYRGQGIGSQLIEKALSIAHGKKASYIEFTSNPERVANQLYEKLGFTKRDTNVYRMNIDYAEA